MSCPDCFRGGKANGEPKGTISTLYGVETYVAEPTTPSTQSTIIIFTDAFGLTLVNNKLIADSFAAQSGFRVLVPDIIPGGGMNLEVIPLMDAAMASVSLWNIPGQLSRAWSIKKALGYVLPWYSRAGPGPKTVKICLEYARKVKADLPSTAKLGVAGYCWGGFQGLHISAEPSVEGGSEALVNAFFCAHPAKCDIAALSLDLVTKFKTPYSLAHAKNDWSMKTAKVEEAQALLKQKVGDGSGADGHHYEVKIYEDCVHGFAIRARPDNEKESEAADQALGQAVDWFKKWL